MRLKVSNVCQLLDKSKYPVTTTNKGITITNNGDGSLTLNGTATSEGEIYSLQYINLINGHKYFIYDNQGGSFANIVFTLDALGSAANREGNIWTCNITSGPLRRSAYFYVVSGTGISNRIYKPQLFDLTEMYGAGNEPTTVEQFRQDFPNEMYDYSPVCWKKFRRLKYIANKQPVQLYAKNIWQEYTDLYGVSIKNNNDGSITLNGTATQTFYYTNRLDYEIKPNHKYLYVDYYPQTPSWDTYIGGCESKVDHEGPVQFAIYNTNNDGTIAPSSPNLPSNTLLNTFCMCYKGFTLNNVTIKPQLFDLTAMYGAGNEPTTVEQFRADFPNELYDYNPYNYLTLNRGKYIANKEPVQLLDKSRYPATQTINGVTFTNNGDGTFTVNGTATNNTYFDINGGQLVCTPNKKYLLCGCPTGGSWTTFNLYISQASDKGWLSDSADFGNGNVFTGVADATRFGGVIIFIVKNQTVNNLVFKPQLFELTAMYGAGNEPTTVAQFRADYPNELYDYNPYNAITFR